MHAKLRFTSRRVAVTSILVLLVAAVVAVTLAHVTAAPVYAGAPSPSWWSGDCDVNNHPGSHPLGASFNGVEACGPGPLQGGADHWEYFFKGAWGEEEWECVELVMRYMYLIDGVVPYNANGSQVVSNYKGSRFTQVANNGASLPAPGDIFSMGATNTLGHTAVVTQVSVSNGTGTITAMEQNNHANGWDSITVKGNVLGGGVTGWLHAPPPPPPDPGLFAGKIVHWDGDRNTPMAAWLVSPDLKRYWIPDGSTFNCLTSSGFAFAGALDSTTLKKLPDQSGHWARCGSDSLGSNQYLFRGSSLVSSNGQYHLELQRSDGNLVLTGPKGTELVSDGASADYLVLQPDGNLVAFSYKDGATWATNTANKGASHLVVGNDGNLVLATADGRTVWVNLFGLLNVSAKLTATPTAHATATPTPSPVSHGGPPPTPTPTPPPTPTPTPTPVPQQQTWTEQEGDLGANSFANPHNASGVGPHLDAMTYVQVSCKLYDPYIASVNPDGYWYRIASANWNNNYYVAANTFWNGDIPGQKPYTHNTDWNVPNC